MLRVVALSVLLTITLAQDLSFNVDPAAVWHFGLNINNAEVCTDRVKTPNGVQRPPMG